MLSPRFFFFRKYLKTSRLIEAFKILFSVTSNKDYCGLQRKKLYCMSCSPYSIHNHMQRLSPKHPEILEKVYMNMAKRFHVLGECKAYQQNKRIFSCRCTCDANLVKRLSIVALFWARVQKGKPLILWRCGARWEDLGLGYFFHNIPVSSRTINVMEKPETRD